MNLGYTSHFERKLQKKIRKSPSLDRKIRSQLELLLVEFNHPRLKTHKLQGSRADEYAIWIEGNLRITLMLMEDGILLTDLITHDEY